MNKKTLAENPWTAEDEKKHPSSTLEWWSVLGFFTSKEDSRHWSLKATLSEGIIDPQHFGSLTNIALLDEDAHHQYVFIDRKLNSEMEASQDVFEVHLDDSSMKGRFPLYEILIRDPKNDILIEMTLHAEVFPHWVAQEASNGWLPMALGVFRYGFIPKLKITGTMSIQGKRLTIEGTGYFEHVWGNFSFIDPFSQRRNLGKTLGVYARLLGWWLSQQKPRVPSSLMWSTENNPLGYDWVWAVLDNGWTIFYGNILGFFMEGPATGLLILSKDERTYTEFGNLSFRYTKTRFAQQYDFQYPTELEITAHHNEETLHLRFTMTSSPREYLSRFSQGRFWLGFVICEAPGIVEGEYTKDTEKICLKGTCKIEPQRQVSVIGHNSLRIDFLKPPRGAGISVEFDSHYLGKTMSGQLQILPKLRIRFHCSRNKKSDKKTSRSVP